MNALEVIGLLTVIGFVLFAITQYQQQKDAESSRKEALNTFAMLIAHKTTVHRLYLQHKENNIREILKKIAEETYGAISEKDFDLSNEQYWRTFLVNDFNIIASQIAEGFINEHGYPLAIVNEKVIRRWGHTGKIFIKYKEQ